MLSRQSDKGLDFCLADKYMHVKCVKVLSHFCPALITACVLAWERLKIYLAQEEISVNPLMIG